VIRPYEAVIVYDGTLPEETLRSEQEKVEQFLKKNAEFEQTEVWGKQPLAYEIRKKRTGNYLLFLFKGENDMPAKLGKELKLNTAVLRFLCVVRSNHPVVAPNVAPAAPAGEEVTENA